MGDYQSTDIKRLLQAVAAKTGNKLVYGQFHLIYEKMKKEYGALPFAEEYLYKKVFLKVKNADEELTGHINLNDQNIEAIAEFLGYEGYTEFIEEQLFPAHPAMENFIGSWYSYVRCNSGSPDVLVSPVEIFREKKDVRMRLHGPTRVFTGELEFEENCLYCLLKSGKGKNIYLVFKAGLSQQPNVLQGVFSGLSSGGDPIAGREVLVRQHAEFSELKNKKLSIAAMLNSENDEERLIARYFSKQEKNILRGGKASTFELTDLR